MEKSSIFCLLFVMMTLTCEAVGTDTPTQLLDDILTGYDHRVKPSGLSSPLQVMFKSDLIQIIDVDEKNQVINSVLWNEAEWRDERLVWNPDMYDGIDRINLPHDAVWHPIIELNNNADLALSLKSYYSLQLEISSDGSVKHAYMVNYRSSCSMNLLYFPFDTQDCLMQYTSYQYCESELNLTLHHSGFEDSFYVESSEFDLISLTATKNTDSSGMMLLDFHMLIQRRSMFYVMNMILPCCLISLVAMLSFYLPAESGEKTGLGITVLLSMSVFLLILSDQMPPTSNYPLIGYYYFGVILMITLSTGFSVLTVGLHHCGDVLYQEVPEWLKNLCFDKLSKLLCLKLRSVTKGDNSKLNSEGRSNIHPTLPHNKITPTSDNPCELSAHVNVMDDSAVQSSGRRISDTLEEILTVLYNLEGRRLRDDECSHIRDEWRQVALIIDRALLVIFFSISVIFTFIMILISWSAPAGKQQ